jgi:ribosome-binding factor A
MARQQRFHRSDRINALLRKEVALLVHHDVKNGYLPELSVSDVEVTKDLSIATVYVTALRGEDGLPGVEALKELAKGYRMALSKTLILRSVPALKFKYDDSADRGERIDALLREKPPGG